jgi:hypothetical protein
MPFVIIFILAAFCSTFFIVTDFVVLITQGKRYTSPAGRIFIDFFILIVCPALYMAFSFEYEPMPALVNSNVMRYGFYALLTSIVLSYFLLYSQKRLPEDIQSFLVLMVLLGIVVNLYFMSFQEPFFIFFHILIVLHFINQLIQSTKILIQHYHEH